MLCQYKIIHFELKKLQKTVDIIRFVYYNDIKLFNTNKRGDKMTIFNRFRQIITDRGIKQNFLAEKARWTPDKMSKILRGDQKMTAEDFLTLCNVLELDPKDFKSDTDAA